METHCNGNILECMKLILMRIPNSKGNAEYLGWPSFITRWGFQQDWFAFSWVAGQGGSHGNLQSTQGIAKTKSCFLQTDSRWPHCWRQHPYNSLNMEMSSWSLHGAFSQWYSAGYRRRGMDSKSATKLLTYDLSCLQIMRRQLWHRTSVSDQPLSDLT